MNNKKCPKCGYPIEAGSKFCENCGLNLSVPYEPAPAVHKKKKSHLGLILGITIPVIVIGIVVILFLTGVIPLPFSSADDKMVGTWYQYAAYTGDNGFCSLQDLATLQEKQPADIRLTMTLNKDGSGQIIGGGAGASSLYWSEKESYYTITWNGQIYTGMFETDEQFTMSDSDNQKLYFSKDINHQIPNQIEVTPSPEPTPEPTPVPTLEPYNATPTMEPYPEDAPDDLEDEDEEEEEGEAGVDDGDYIFPNSDSEYLTKSDLKGMSKSEINLAKNELYARHGRKFKSKELQEYFESKSWYKGIYSPKQWDKKGDKYFFNKYEIKNRNLLKKNEK